MASYLILEVHYQLLHKFTFLQIRCYYAFNWGEPETLLHLDAAFWCPTQFVILIQQQINKYTMNKRCQGVF